MEKFRELHKSPDGILDFGVSVADSGDITIGFVARLSPISFYGHTHGNILERLMKLPMEQAISEYVQSVLSSEMVIAVIRIAGSITDIYIPDDLGSGFDFLDADEELELRYWNGDLFEDEATIDG